MLEGLEISEVHYSKVTLVTETVRFDPEYFQQRHLLDSAHVTSAVSSFCSFRDIGISIDASAFYPAIEAFYDQGDLPFLRVADVDSVIDFQACTRIPADLCNRFPTLSKAHPGDIIFTKGGSVARIGLVTETAAVSRDLIFLNTSKLEEANRVFLYIYFQTDFFNRVLLRSSSQTAQPHLTITLVRELPVFLGSHALKNRCLHVIQQSFEARSRAIALQQQAEQTLLRALGLENWQPPEPLTYTRSSQDTFAAGRLDAEYFSPRVAQLLNRLNKDGLTIGDAAPARHERFMASRAGSFDYIEISGVRQDGTAVSETVSHIEAPSRATWFVKTGDVITSTVRPIRRLSALIAPEQNDFVCSSGFLVLQPKAIPPEVLLTYLRLPPFCELMDLHTSASLYPAISEQDLLNLPIPRIERDTQQTIVSAVQSAQVSRRRAAELLNAAKRAVEIAIESGEAAAVEFLNAATKGGFASI
ncbi:MAG: hypothetical protein U1F70_14400 [Candidatus Competibacteraceae bacterium]